MYQLIQPGRIIFGTGITALGVLQFLAKDFIVARPPDPAWAADIPGKLAWAYISAVLLILSGVAVMLNKKAHIAAIFAGILIFIASFLLRNLPDMAAVGSAVELLWKVNSYKTLAFCGGALIVAASCFQHENRNGVGSVTNDHLITAGCICLSLFLIICGIAHFRFADFVKDLVPAYAGNQYFWTYFTATALIAGGIGIAIKQTRKWAAALSGLMILLWLAMLHIPRAVTIPPQTSVPIYAEWMGVFESFTFCGVLFVLAGLSFNKTNK